MKTEKQLEKILCANCQGLWQKRYKPEKMEKYLMHMIAVFGTLILTGAFFYASN